MKRDKAVDIHSGGALTEWLWIFTKLYRAYEEVMNGVFHTFCG